MDNSTKLACCQVDGFRSDFFDPRLQISEDSEVIEIVSYFEYFGVEDRTKKRRLLRWFEFWMHKMESYFFVYP
jgi:hypothetical protein